MKTLSEMAIWLRNEASASEELDPTDSSVEAMRAAADRLEALEADNREMAKTLRNCSDLLEQDKRLLMKSSDLIKLLEAEKAELAKYLGLIVDEGPCNPDRDGFCENHGIALINNRCVMDIARDLAAKHRQQGE